MSEPKLIDIYVDGACSGNPGPGGYGIIVKYNSHETEKSGGFRRTTNNRMELMSAIVALKSLKQKCDVKIYSDSKYLVDAVMQGWAKKWKSNGWMRNRKDKALNPDLWDRLLKLLDQHEVVFHWVRGHDGHPENERCDQLATEALLRVNLPVDEGYENTQNTLFKNSNDKSY